MICPYCVEDIPADSHQHNECKIIGMKGKAFPPYYIEFNSSEDASEPVIVSIVGSVGHGKTVFLCALFDFLDKTLTRGIWPNFFNHVLDQESLSTLNKNRHSLHKLELPPPTQQSFPRPGIFRLTDMPDGAGDSEMPPLADTTVLIYDPPGEAYLTNDKTVQLASFVRRSSCVLFLIDITDPGHSIPDKMAELLDTYLLSMKSLKIEKKSQHMIVVYTKVDEMQSSVPEFADFLKREPKLKEHFSQQRPDSLANPHGHLKKLDYISQHLENFTRLDLNAGKFVTMANYWFASVKFTAVSSLGAAPEKTINDEGKEVTRLSVEMSPRCVIDPLIYVLAKSIKVKVPPPPTWWQHWLEKVGLSVLLDDKNLSQEERRKRRKTRILLGGIASAIMLATMIYFWGFYNAHFRRGYACEQKKDYPCAIENYTRAIEANPDYAKAYSRRGWSYFEQGAYDEAIKDCGKAIELNPDFAEALTCRGRASYFKEAYEQAFKDCDKALHIEPAYAAAYDCRGVIYWHQKQYAQAIKDYDKAIELRPEFAEAYINRGKAYADTGNNEQGFSDYNKAIELEPELAPAYYNRGTLYAHHERYGEAIKDYDKATALKPDYTEAYENRAAIYYSTGNYDQSIEDYDKTIELKPDAAEAYFWRGEAYSQKSDDTHAIADYTKAIELKSDFTEAYFKRGKAYARINDYDQAILNYDEVIKRNTEYVEAYFERGNAFRNKADHNNDWGDYHRAVLDYTAADSKREDGYPQAIYNRGIANIRRNNWELSTGDYAAAIRLDPALKSIPSVDYSNAFFARGCTSHAKADNEIYQRNEDYSSAAQDYTEAIRLNTNAANAYFKRGLVYLAQEEYVQAIEDFNKVLELDPNNSAAYNFLGEVYAKQNKFDLARDNYSQAIKLNPNNIRARNNLAALEY